MHLSAVLIFAFLCLASAAETGPLSIYSALSTAHESNLQVGGSTGVVRVIFLLFFEILFIPFIWYVYHVLTTPVRTAWRIILLPYTMAKFIGSLPRRIVTAPLHIILAPVTLVLNVIRFLKNLFSPLTRVIKFILHVVSFLIGIPVKAFSTTYVI